MAKLNFDVRSSVQDYYGKRLSKSSDLKTSACCSSPPPARYRAVLDQIHPKVAERYYGCGAGRDVYLLSRLVGESGFVIGVDMTEEQLAVARAHREYHRQAFGYRASNVRFCNGYLEELKGIEDCEDGSIDVAVSNCVINLVADKRAVLQGVFDLLKEGGEFYFSDVYADRRQPAEFAENEALYGECLAGALYWADFVRLAQEVGFLDPRLVESQLIEVTDPDLRNAVGPVQHASATYRLIKASGLEPACEDFGQAAIYRGTIDEAARSWTWDAGTRFVAGEVRPLCANAFRMLQASRFAPHFIFVDGLGAHRGPFEGCGAANPFATPASPDAEAQGRC